PRKRTGRTPDGPPIPDYYPAILTENEWHAAGAALASRRGKGGRPGAGPGNLFSGLLKDARDGGGVYVQDKHPGKRPPLLVGYRAAMGVKGSQRVSFPFVEFERAILRQLKEIDPREILPGNGAAERVLTLTGKLADVEGRIE